MAKKFTTAKAHKEPIRLRSKKLADGSESLYLDCYDNGTRSYEFLKLYLVPETSAAARTRNEATLKAANTIKLKRILELTNNKAGLKNTSLKAKVLLSDWMETYRKNHEDRGVKDKKLIRNTIHALTGYGMNIPLYRIDREYLVGLINYLRNDYRMGNGEKIKSYTAINYMACLRNAINTAVREEVLSENPYNRQSPEEKIKKPECNREFLTIEEVKRMEVAPCKYEQIKQAFLFACYCGLRCSDIRKITWGQLSIEGDQHRLHIVMHKTKSPIYLPLSKRAVSWMPERGDTKNDDRIFPTLPEQVSTPIYLQDWLDAAGITKPITFHCRRHSISSFSLKTNDLQNLNLRQVTI